MTPPLMDRRVRWAQFRAVVRFEVQAQCREPLTTLYALVFGLLTMGYAASDAVELVSDRGAVPRTASWAVALAFGGLTAFGQVITTMIATTAMLRDEAQRTRSLVATSGLGPRTWFVARVSAAALVMLLVYTSLPLGTVVGTLLAGGHAGDALRGSAWAFAVITVPTTITVTVVLATAALFTQRVLGVLAAALALVGVWQLSLALVVQPSWRSVGALLDPFGNAPVLAVTSGWSTWQRSQLEVPMGGLILSNRLVWGACSLALLMLAVRGCRHRAFAPSADSRVARRETSGHHSIARSASPRTSVRRFTAAWIGTDGGWRTVSVLAVLNAVGNAMARPLTDAGAPAVGDPVVGDPVVGDPVVGDPVVAALLLVSEHARLFLILLATVYAGELVWRARDVRVHQLVAALPVSRAALVFGQVEGLLLAQRHIVLPLALAALGIAVVRTGVPLADTTLWSHWLAWGVFVLWLPFLQLTLLSLCVHVLLDHKVAAHLLLITGWVLAVVLDGQGVSAWWLRFAEPAALVEQGEIAWRALGIRGAYWTAVSGGLLGVCWWRWQDPRGSQGRVGWG